ncbi:MAG: aminodeoxychorismate/anthranilate synthase component II [Pseudomonadota bacterium]
MILVIDNYDSFTYNLAHLIGGLGEAFVVQRNNAVSVDDVIDCSPKAIVLSPGPGRPEDAGICVPLVKHAATRSIPVFGVCLGLQSIAAAFGGTIVRARQLMHGKTSNVGHNGGPLFKDMPKTFKAARYHSLVAEAKTLPASLKVEAKSADDGEVMALSHITAPIAGVQFHPESIASEHGAALFQNFLNWSATRVGYA